LEAQRRLVLELHGEPVGQRHARPGLGLGQRDRLHGSPDRAHLVPALDHQEPVAEEAELCRRPRAQPEAGPAGDDRTAGRPDHPALKWKDASGAWNTLTWSQYRLEVRKAAAGLAALGFRPGQFAVIMARNRPEHLIADLGVLHARGTPVSLYNTLAPEQVQYI